MLTPIISAFRLPLSLLFSHRALNYIHSFVLLHKGPHSPIYSISKSKTPTDEAFDEPDRLQLINELSQALGFSEVNITTWLCAWFADVGCLRQLIGCLQTPLILQVCLSEEFDSGNSIFKDVMKTCKLTCSHLTSKSSTVFVRTRTQG